MYIEKLELQNFRNYDSLSLELDSGINILYGDNAQGKTNILEAVYLCGTTRSHRRSRDREMIHFDRDDAHICMHVRKKNLPCRIDMHIKKHNAKGIAIDGIPIRRAADLFGAVSMVFFSPEDLQMIKSGPSGRRRFMDSELCQLSRVYVSDLTMYNRILNQRNRLLKEIPFDRSLADTLDVWDAQLVQYGTGIIEERIRFIEEMNDVILDIHNNITDGREQLKLIYEPSVTGRIFAQKLAADRERDFHFKLTSSGPHRDDFCVSVNDIDIRKYGSQGQQRTAALSLKLSEIHIVNKVIGDSPILLLDDVLSELDETRQNCLLNSITDVQALITCTGLDEFVNHRFKINKVYKVEHGTVM